MSDTSSNIMIHGFITKTKVNKETGKTEPWYWLDWSPKHNAIFSRNTHPVEDFRPPKFLKNDDDGQKAAIMHSKWAVIEPAYKAFLEGNELPETGTPLAAWAGCTKEAADVLKANYIRTVEDFAAATDAQIGRIQLPNVRALRDQAKAFLDGADKVAANAKVADLSDQLEAAMQMIAELQANQPKRRRKDEVEDEAA
jgi:hypothetical protein